MGDFLVSRYTRRADGFLQWLRQIWLAALALRGHVCFEPRLKQVKVVRTGDERSGELPDELGEILAADGSQQRIGKVVELHTWIVEIEGFDSSVRKYVGMEPTQKTRLSGTVLPGDDQCFCAAPGLVGVQDGTSPFRQGGRRR